jgi:tripartite-type tricarboxylate transporter receptor subunit TctC
MWQTRPARAAALVVSLLALAAPAALAQGYPTKPVRVVVPFSPGGGVDLTARILAQRLTERTGTNFIVENRASANGTIGAEYVAKAAPDGYTLLVGSQTTQAVVPAIYGKVGYDPERDFAPVTLIATSPLILVVHPSLPVKSVKDLIALAKARPGQLTFGAAAGGTPHMGGELFKLTARIDLMFIPYKGEGPALADAIGGQISMVFANLPVGLPHVKSGRLRGLAVTSPQRVPLAPDIPTVAESGLPGYDVYTWFGLFAPAGTPREVVAKLAAEAAAGLSAPEAREKMASLGLFVVANAPDTFAEFVKKEIPRWAKVVREAGVKPQ